MTKYIVDTCIWRDFYENRTNKSGKNIGTHASKFFYSVIKRKEKIIFCKSLLYELRKSYTENEINTLLGLLSYLNILVQIEIKKQEYYEAKLMSTERNLPFGDCITAILARNHGAKIITRDAHFFKELKDIADSFRPEDTI